MDDRKIVEDAIRSIQPSSISAEGGEFPARLTFGADCSGKKIQTAIAHYAKTAKPQDVVAMSDTSFFGSGKSGYLFTHERMCVSEAGFPKLMRYAEMAPAEFKDGILIIHSSFEEFGSTANDGPERLFEECKKLGADQVTLRVLYSDDGDSPQSQWIRENKASDQAVKNICNYVMYAGKPLGRLPYGAIKYSLNGMSVVIDDDCMAKKKDVSAETDDAVKYLILQPDCKLYSQWDDPASLIF